MPLAGSASRGSPLSGIVLLVLATACFAVLDTTVKYVGASVSVLVAVWFRYLFQAVAVTAIMLPMRGRSLFSTAHPRFQLLRGALLLLVSALSFVSVQLLPLAEFTAINMITPLAVTLLAAIFLKERVSVGRWWLVTGGFCGALLVAQPGSALLGWASLVPLAMVLTYAWFHLLTGRLARTEDAMTMHAYTGWVGTALASAALPFVWQTLPDGRTFALLCLVGLMGTVGHFLLILAFARAATATLAPYMYAQIAFAMLCGWLVFGHVPGALELSGMALIALCGIAASYLAARERDPNRTACVPPEA